MKLNIVHFVFIIVSCILIHCQAITHFHPSHAIIHLRLDGEFFEDEKLDLPKLIMHQFEVVAEKFQRIMIQLSPSYYLKVYSLIPEAVAKINLKRSNASKMPLDLNIYYRPARNDLNHSMLNQSIELANSANKIFPKTVTTFYLDYSEKTCEKFETDISSAVNILSASDENYKFGLFLLQSSAQPLYNCMLESNTMGLSKLGAVLFQENLKNGDDATPLDVQLQAILKEFLETKQAFEKIRQLSGKTPIETVFYARFLHLSISDDIKINIWKQINDWTWETNTTYAYYEAFDQPARYEYDGWWRRSDKRQLSTGIHEYVEKEVGTSKTTINQKVDADKRSTNDCPNSAGTYAHLICFILGLFALFQMN